LLQEQQLQLVTHLEQQTSLEAELTKLKSEGLGPPPAALAVSPQNLLAFMRTFLATVAPTVVVDFGVVENLGQQMGWFPPADVSMDGPGGPGTDPAPAPAPIPVPVPPEATAPVEIDPPPDRARARSRSSGRTPPANRPTVAGTLNHWIKVPSSASAPTPAETADTAAAAVSAASSSSA
jgi:hypothetical protein